MKQFQIKPDNSSWVDKSPKFDFILKMLFAMCIIAVFCTRSHAQSHCEKDKLFVAEMKIEMPMQYVDAPMVSAGMGISGIYGKGTLLDNMTGIIGAKMIKITIPGKSTNDALQIIPTVTAMYKIRMNGSESGTVHGLAFISGLGNKYYGFDYRAYVAPNGYSFATIGGIAGWDNQTGWHIGFAAIGFF